MCIPIFVGFFVSEKSTALYNSRPIPDLSRKEMLTHNYSYPLLENELKLFQKLEKKYEAIPIKGDADLQPETVAKLLGMFEESPEDPIYFIDIGKVMKQMILWRQLLPNVKPFYAVKCNGNPALIDLLTGMGCGFDCASIKESQAILNNGVTPERILLANPCLPIPLLKFAQEKGVQKVVADSEAGLEKIHVYHPGAKILIRIITDDSASLCQFSCKFGATLETAFSLLKLAKNLSLDIIGVSFHVGSGCGDAQAFGKAVRAAHVVWREALSLGFNMKLLDIGGGFPGSEAAVSFSEIAGVLQRTLVEYFPGVQVIAEPGRYFAAASHLLVTTVVNKRVVRSASNLTVDANGNTDCQIKEEYQYYLNDGVYQSFNCLFFDHAKVTPYPLPRCTNAPTPTPKVRPTTLFGPTCDGLDCICRNIPCEELDIGDYVLFPNMGAYTVAAASPFNGYYKWNYIYVNSLVMVYAERELMLRNVRKTSPITGRGRATVSGFKLKAENVAQEGVMTEI
jgi:ornithine decarboxylase